MPLVDVAQAEFKVVVLGDSHVGKTSLVTRFAEGYYRENSREPTVGAFFVTKRIQSSDGTPTKVQIWDTAGQESFHQIASMFYKNAAAIIFCYDVTSRESFDGMRRWLDGVRSATPRSGGGKSDGMVLAIAGLKSDLLTYDSVPEAEASALADALGAIHVPTSAKADVGVDELFRGLADMVLMNSRVVGCGGIATPSVGGRSAGGTQQHPPTPSRIDGHGTDPPSDDDGAHKPRRDQFDRYHSKSDGNRHSSSSGNSQSSNQNRDGAARTSSQGSASASGPSTRRRSSSSGGSKRHPSARSSTPSTQESDGWEASPDNGDGRRRGSGGGRYEGEACACHPTASCGAMDGGTGCSVQ